MGIAAPPGPLVVIASAGARETETMAAQGGVAGGQRLRRARPGAGPDLHPGRRPGSCSRRVRSRLARLSGAGLTVSSQSGAPDGAPLVGAVTPFTGPIAAEDGLYHRREGEYAQPVEPDTRLLSETELWRLLIDVVNAYSGELHTDETPAAVTAVVLRLWGSARRAPGRTGQLRDTHVELERLVHTLPAGRSTSAMMAPARGCCACWPPRPSAPS